MSRFLSDLFKSRKPAALRPAPAVRWFGKLPTYSDYYSSPADEDWAAEFNDWILKGYDLYLTRLSERARSGGGGDGRGERLPISGCVVRLPKSGMTVLASILDFGGDMRGRPFPMCFYVGVPTADWPGPPSDGVLPAARAVRELLALKDLLVRFVNAPARFETTFGQREVSVDSVREDARDDSWRREAGGIPIAEWFEAARAAFEVDGFESWLSTVRSWGRAIAQNESDSFEPTLRFPVVSRWPVETQTAGWLRWLESRMDVRRRALTLTIGTDVTRERGALSVVARPPITEDFLLLTPLADGLSYVDDLSRLRPASGDASDGSSSDRRVPESWLEFVEEPNDPAD